MAAAVGPRPGRRVPGREPDPGRHRQPALPRWRRAHRGRRRRPGGVRVPRRRQPAPARPGRRRCPTRGRSAWSRTSGRGNGSWPWPTRSGRPPAGSRCGCAPTATAARDRAWSAAMTRRPRRAWWSTRVLAAPNRAGRCASQAVLMRAAHHSDLLEVELTARRVPFVKYGGLKFLEAAHVKDFIADRPAARQPARRDRLVPAAAAARRHRPGPGPRAARRAAPGRARHRAAAPRRGRGRPGRQPGPRSPPPSAPWPRPAGTATSPPGPRSCSTCCARC